MVKYLLYNEIIMLEC